MSVVSNLTGNGRPLELANVNTWPQVKKKSVKKKHRKRFVQIRDAVRLYCKGVQSFRGVEALTGMPASTIRYYYERALELNDDGRINGERAFVRHACRSDYMATGDAPEGISGKFKLLRKQYPQIDEIIRKGAVKGKTLEKIHKEVKGYLEEEGFTDDDYPLNSDSQGEWSVNQVLIKMRSKYFQPIAEAKGGRDAGRRASSTQPMQLDFPVRRPYQRIELDAHTLHAMFTIDIEELDGEVRTTVLRRLAIICAIDSESRAILGYRICMNNQPTVEDVCLALVNALDPQNEDAADILGYVTGSGFGLPESFMDRLRYRTFNELALDNALAHVSPALHEALIGHVNCAINCGKSAHPEGRPLIEGWFKKFAKFLADPLPSATGGAPKSPKRRNPSKKAKHYKISLADLELLTEAVIRGHNQGDLGVTTGRSPLQKLEYRLTRTPGLVRYLRPEDRKLDFLFYRYKEASIRGSVSTGTRPYIQFLNAIYRNHTLSAMGAMIGTKVTIRYDLRDLRTIEAYLPSGESLGILAGQGGWGRTPHSLQTRRAINRHRNQHRVRDVQGDYVRWFVEHILAAKKRKASTANVVKRIAEEGERADRRAQEDAPDKPRKSDQRNLSHWLDIGPDIDLYEEDDE